MNESLTLPITDASRVGEARRKVAALAARLGFNETYRSNVSIAVTEAANNLVRHAEGGELLVTPVEHGGVVGLELLALDKGPGMVDVERCLRDGYSTGGTAGTGLGAIKRLSDNFEVYSPPGRGAAVFARFWSGGQAPAAQADMEAGGVCVPVISESVCGDGWAISQRPGGLTIIVADGLGHGPLAAEASGEAVRLFLAKPGRTPTEILEAAHVGMRATRGAAVAVATIDLAARELRYAGLGNISAVIAAGAESRSLISHNGTVGLQVRKVQGFTYPFPPGALLILHSDGVTTHWRLDQQRGLAGRPPALIAGVLYRDFKRGRDDATVVVVKEVR